MQCAVASDDWLRIPRPTSASRIRIQGILEKRLVGGRWHPRFCYIIGTTLYIAKVARDSEGKERYKNINWIPLDTAHTLDFSLKTISKSKRGNGAESIFELKLKAQVKESEMVLRLAAKEEECIEWMQLLSSIKDGPKVQETAESKDKCSVVQKVKRMPMQADASPPETRHEPSPVSNDISRGDPAQQANQNHEARLKAMQSAQKAGNSKGKNKPKITAGVENRKQVENVLDPGPKEHVKVESHQVNPQPECPGIGTGLQSGSLNGNLEEVEKEASEFDYRDYIADTSQSHTFSISPTTVLTAVSDSSSTEYDTTQQKTTSLESTQSSDVVSIQGTHASPDPSTMRESIPQMSDADNREETQQTPDESEPAESEETQQMTDPHEVCDVTQDFTDKSFGDSGTSQDQQESTHEEVTDCSQLNHQISDPMQHTQQETYSMSMDGTQEDTNSMSMEETQQEVYSICMDGTQHEDTNSMSMEETQQEVYSICMDGTQQVDTNSMSMEETQQEVYSICMDGTQLETHSSTASSLQQNEDFESTQEEVTNVISTKIPVIYASNGTALSSSTTSSPSSTTSTNQSCAFVSNEPQFEPKQENSCSSSSSISTSSLTSSSSSSITTTTNTFSYGANQVAHVQFETPQPSSIPVSLGSSTTSSISSSSTTSFLGSNTDESKFFFSGSESAGDNGEDKGSRLVTAISFCTIKDDRTRASLLSNASAANPDQAASNEDSIQVDNAQQDDEQICMIIENETAPSQTFPCDLISGERVGEKEEPTSKAWMSSISLNLASSCGASLTIPPEKVNGKLVNYEGTQEESRSRACSSLQLVSAANSSQSYAPDGYRITQTETASQPLTSSIHLASACGTSQTLVPNRSGVDYGDTQVSTAQSHAEPSSYFFVSAATSSISKHNNDDDEVGLHTAMSFCTEKYGDVISEADDASLGALERSVMRAGTGHVKMIPDQKAHDDGAKHAADDDLLKVVYADKSIVREKQVSVTGGAHNNTSIPGTVKSLLDANDSSGTQFKVVWIEKDSVADDNGRQAAGQERGADKTDQLLCVQPSDQLPIYYFRDRKVA